MPRHKRESLIYTIMMCFCMVLWMSIYNVALHSGQLNGEILKEAWLGFPLAYICAMLLDWFVVSGIAKGFAFRFLVKPESETWKKVIAAVVMFVVLFNVQKMFTVSIRASFFEIVIGIAVYGVVLLLLRDSFLCMNVKRMMGRIMAR